MNKMLKQIVVVLLLATMSLMTVGCYGSFTLTKKVYNWNGSLGDKFVVELVFLGLLVVPVYSIAGGIDAIILNSLEFWTGKNPMTSMMTTDDGTQVAFNAEKKQMEISHGEKTFVLVRENGKTMVKDSQGAILAIAVAGENGTMTLIDAQGKVLSAYSADEVSAVLAVK